MKPFVIATVLDTQGSTPRETGAKILISAQETMGTIGGGKLEFEVINTARTFLSAGKSETFNHQQDYILGTELGQCCGGRLTMGYQLSSDVKLWQDPTQATSQHFNIVLFGAGHVGQAIVNILSTQPCQVHWVDSRPEIFPSVIPSNVTSYRTDSPTGVVADMPENSYYLIMTHDHGLDLELCDHVLSRGDFRFLGLIGSETKATRFRRQLIKRGLEQQDVERITCPIGIEGIRGKLPSSIALGVVAQLVELEERAEAHHLSTTHLSGENCKIQIHPVPPFSKEGTLQQNSSLTGAPPPLIHTFCFVNVAQGERGGFKSLTPPIPEPHQDQHP